MSMAAAKMLFNC